MLTTDILRITEQLDPYWTEFQWVETTGSTNDDLLKEGEPGTVLVAGEQTASRGRLGREWVSPQGAQLAFSVVIDAGEHPSPYGLLSIAPGVAITDVLPQAELKWPNDVQIAGKKIAGILSSLDGRRVIVGVGINTHFAAEDLPTPTSTSLNLEGIEVDDVDFTLELLAALAKRLKQWQDGDPELLDRYRQVCATIGQRVRIELHDGEVVGVVDGVNANGEVIIDGTAYSVGDVHHLRPKQ